MKTKKRVITEKEQRVAADILTYFWGCKTTDEFFKVWQEIFAAYGLHTDPFTSLPESAGQHAKSCYELTSNPLRTGTMCLTAIFTEVMSHNTKAPKLNLYQ